LPGFTTDFIVLGLPELTIALATFRACGVGGSALSPVAERG
jgi:hypothetical protein